MAESARVVSNASIGYTYIFTGMGILLGLLLTDSEKFFQCLLKAKVFLAVLCAGVGKGGWGSSSLPTPRLVLSPG